MSAVMEYKQDDVLTAARKRIGAIFDHFSRVVVCTSSGKDSTVLYHLAQTEALLRGRKIDLFFLDQEAEYASNITLMREMMASPGVIPRWHQIPIRLTNATSHKESFLTAWEPGRKWMREKEPGAIHEAPGKRPDRIKKFFEWYEGQAKEPTAFLVGLRSTESLNRYRASVGKPGFHGIPNCTWSKKTKSRHCFRFYPIFDWFFGDVWKYIADNDVPYNRIYDWMFMKNGINIARMRVSHLLHVESFRCLADLQEFEPDTYERLVRRIGGVHAAALYGKEKLIFDVKARPAAFATWEAYRDHLLESTPAEKINHYRERFSREPRNERQFRMQCKQILVNDWQNEVPIAKGMRPTVRETWWNRL